MGCRIAMRRGRGKRSKSFDRIYRIDRMGKEKRTDGGEMGRGGEQPEEVGQDWGTGEKKGISFWILNSDC